MKTRADKIYDILKANGNRLRVFEIVNLLAQKERTTKLQAKLISSTVLLDNKTRELKGKAPRFSRYGDGTETYGFVSIRNLDGVADNLPEILDKYENQIPAIIEQANNIVREQLKAAIRKLSWKEFETNFLYRILEALGFQSISITKRTNDDGTDAYCTYNRGLVKSRIIVSAKHWNANVGKEEVQRLRGIKGSADTGVIVTSASFTREAIKEAEPSQNQRAIVLLDADIIVETCFDHLIGAKCIALPNLYKFTELKFDSEAYDVLSEN